jgi:putrescine aminotransferase
VIIPPPGYWQQIEAICRKYGILLVSDEVICGFGRLGEWFGFQHFGISPDIVSMAKGLSSGYLPISATGVSSAIVETLRASGEEFVHGYTYSGHPVCAAVALRNIQILEDELLIDRTREDTGPYLAKAMAERLAPHALVGEARSLGLLGAVEIVAEQGTNRRFGTGGQAAAIVRDACIARGVMVRAVRDSLVMSPPLVITHAEIDQIVDTIVVALDASADQLMALE